VADLDVFDARIDGLFRHFHPRVLGGTQRHQLHHRHRQVITGRFRFVAPAAFVVLAGDNEVHGFAQDFPHAAITGLAPRFSQGQAGQGMMVHRMRPSTGTVQQAIRLRMREDVLDRLGGDRAVLAAAGNMAMRHESERAHGGEADEVAFVGKAAISALTLGQMGQAAVDRSLHFRRHAVAVIDRHGRREGQDRQQQCQHRFHG